MKTPEQIYDDFHIADALYPHDLTSKQVILDAIKMAGIDGWNSALDWADAVDTDSILKGKK